MNAARILLSTWLSLAALAGCREHSVGESSTAAHQAHPSRITIAAGDEPGDALEVSGRVFQLDGKTPAAGVTVYVYHTDITGHYAREPGQPPRLRGWMTTDAEGRYAFRTIEPAAYPTGRDPAHIHLQAWGGGWPVQYAGEIFFEGDPLLSADERERSQELGSFGTVKRLERGADGVSRCVRDLRLKDEADEFEDSTMHGVRDEPGA